MATHEGPQRLCTPRDIHRELVALQTEFDDVKLDLKARTLTVATTEIVLEYVNLGRFEIVLHWDQLDEDDVYEVIALDPHPTAGDSSMTHPHVRDERLCEGDGRLPIRRALAQGRICDFFVLVRQILETYNPSSAFVSLEHWSGTPCQDCGRMTDEDDSTSCERCDDNLCLDCSTSCHDCGRSCCAECRTACSGCDRDFCGACLERCLGCRKEFCANCRSADRCTACQNKEKQLHDQNDSSTDNQGTAAQESYDPLHPLCLGQTSVPA
jgi:hypothetical protein